MHAASGSDGFLALTLTSRIARLEVNQRLLAKIELFAASLAPWKIRPIEAQIRIRSDGIHQLYMELIRRCYLTPAIQRALPLALAAFNLKGRIGIIRARRRLKKRLEG